jgi:hypothetical protein
VTKLALPYDRIAFAVGSQHCAGSKQAEGRFLQLVEQCDLT